MQAISYARHQFPAEVIRHAVWLYLRFTQLPRCQGALGRARHRDLLRNRPTLGPEVWASVRSEAASPATSTHGHLALGRNGATFGEVRLRPTSRPQSA